MWSIVLPLALRQQRAFSATQALAGGVSRSWITRAARTGLVTRQAPAVYVVGDEPMTWRTQVVVHCLAAGPGARATADSALALWCDELCAPRRPVIAVPRNCGYSTTGAEIRRSRDLHLAKPGVLDGVPVVGVARALLDASLGRSPDQVLALVDACRRHRPIAVGALIEALEVHRRPGRPGVTVFEGALRSLRSEVSDSEFERLVIRDLERAGVPAARLHHVVRLPGEDPIELDLDWPGRLLDVELDGGDHVRRARRARRDRRRDRLLQAAGYQVLRYTWDDDVIDRRAMLAEIAGFVARSAGRR